MRGKKWTRQEKWLLLVPLLCLMLPLVMWSYRSDTLDRKLRALAGQGAVNCGVLHGNERERFETIAESIDACCTQANQRQKPFFARQNVLLDGVEGASGVVRTPDGRMLFVYCSRPSSPVFFGYVEPLKVPKPFHGNPPQWLLY